MNNYEEMSNALRKLSRISNFRTRLCDWFIGKEISADIFIYRENSLHELNYHVLEELIELTKKQKL